ncbi:hypothetical protein [Azospirillum doebereinerae]|uniref:Uncharacterized protein n=1 Tax=Azospirillum doebereinerae TaxID=92933 RepID=A0A3S0XPU0_9PROT|nr:hypothetical protein [Azospirillum doebereinerae]MCG5241436.1 hypothetical protein [Azospirillum doebereinerae]RUQ74482.1 hypothetical protein EJ913_05370 [Azospirillum doebereinerae]
MSDPILVSTGLAPGLLPALVEFAATQTVAMSVGAFLLLYALLSLSVRLADRFDPPPAQGRVARRAEPAPERVWRFRKLA